MNKKTLVFFLVLILIFTTVLTGCGKKDKEPSKPDVETTETSTTEAKKPETTEQTRPEANKNQAIWGFSTEADGNWNGITYWGNNATDNAIASLMGDMGTVQHDFAGDLKVNESVVEKYETKENEDKSKTYIWTIKDGLVYSDGSPITAKDYAAGMMLFGSPQFAMFNAKTANGPYKIKGFEKFSSGESKEFEGVRLIDEKTFSVTIDPEFLPNFYEMLTAAAGPEKLSFWLGDDVDIKDDGQGCYFTGDFSEMVTYGKRELDKDENPIQPERTPEQEKIFTKYNDLVKTARDSAPPSSGPYVLDSFDKSTKEVVLKINPNYPGDFEGKKPSIETVIIRKAVDATALDQLKTGAIDVLDAIMDGEKINAAIDLCENNEGFDYTTYPRSGYGMLHFHSDFGPTRFKEVRQAVAHLLNRQDFVQRFTGGFGTVVDGPYGESQWFYKESQAELQSTLNHYSYSLQDAVKLLEQAGYTLNEKGEPFTPNTDEMRYRKNEETGELEPLLLKWCSTADNPVSEILVITLQNNPDVKTAGIKIEQDTMDFTELYSYYRRSGDDPKYTKPTYNMFNLASNFPVGYLPDKSFTTDPQEVKQGVNVFFLFDDELDKLSRSLTNFAPDDREGYRKQWVKYIQRWNELVPEIPLYSNTLHDVYNSKIEGYVNSAVGKIHMVLLGCSIK